MSQAIRPTQPCRAVIEALCSSVADPSCGFTSEGTAVAIFTVAANDRRYDPSTGQWVDKAATFLRCSIWRQAAENLAESLTRGARVQVARTLESLAGASIVAGGLVDPRPVDLLGETLGAVPATQNPTNGNPYSGRDLADHEHRAQTAW